MASNYPKQSSHAPDYNDATSGMPSHYQQGPPPAYSETFSAAGQGPKNSGAAPNYPDLSGHRSDDGLRRQTIIVTEHRGREYIPVESGNVVVLNAVQLGRFPVRITCPRCSASVVTQVERRTGAYAWLLTGLTCLVFWPLFFVPLCADCSQDAVHRCPACRKEIGVAKQF